MAEPDDVGGRHKAGHDCGGRSINSDRYKSRQSIAEKQKARYTLPHDQSRRPHRPDHVRSVPGPFPPKGEREKNLSTSRLVTH
jgi:hypothetical protein